MVCRNEARFLAEVLQSIGLMTLGERSELSGKERRFAGRIFFDGG
jgi:hypothetical protein